MRTLITAFPSFITKIFTHWIVLVPAMTGLGIAAGVLGFVYLSSGKPSVGVIDVPYTVLSDRSASAISQYIDYASENDSIKAVVIKLTSPGGSAAASERLYIETRRLRTEKPVVIVMGRLVASGGYMMAMGASHTYAQTSSLVGNVGVISAAGPLVPSLPNEATVFSSPYKLSGAPRREWVGTVDLLSAAFVQMVVSERGERLRISGEEVAEARIYPGLVAVRLGLADDIGGDSDGIRKAAELAGISNYDLVDVNYEVLREFVREMDQLIAPDDGSDIGDVGLIEALAAVSQDKSGGENDSVSAEPGDVITGLQNLRYLALHGGLGSEEDPFPDLPLELHDPGIYYLYVGHVP